MATFSGGEAITAVKTLSVGAGGSAQTVPTGKYWEFQIRDNAGGGGDFTINGVTIDATIRANQSAVLWANASEVVELSSGTAEIIVKEYNKPA